MAALRAGAVWRAVEASLSWFPAGPEQRPTTGTTGTQASLAQSAPGAENQQNGQGGTLNFSFNTTSAARALGTISPSHDFDIQSQEAINIPPRIRVYQNNRNAEAAGVVIPVPVGISANEALEDMVYDATRQKLFIANSGMNRVEVFDIAQNQFLAGIKVGQLPRSLAMTPDGATLYVANSGWRDHQYRGPRQAAGNRPREVSAHSAGAEPVAIHTRRDLSGATRPIFTMNVTATNGTSTASLWQIIGNTAVPRGVSQVIGATNNLPKALTGPVSMAATPGGEFIVVAAGDGSTYLYDASADDFVQARTLTSFTQSQGLGYYGPVTAGPKGQYYVVNGQVLNQALDPTNPTATGTTIRPVAAVATAGATTFVRLTQPARTSTTALPTDAGTVDLVDATSGQVMRSMPALEGPMAQATSTGRATAIAGRTIAIDSAMNNAYAITTSGLSIIPMTPTPASAQPKVSPKGAVNAASYLSAVAPNSLLSIFGVNLASAGQASSTPLPDVLGGTCVTLNNTPLPLIVTSAGQINAQIPPGLAAGTYPLVVRSIANKAAGASQQITVIEICARRVCGPGIGTGGAGTRRRPPGYQEQSGAEG